MNKLVFLCYNNVPDFRLFFTERPVGPGSEPFVGTGFHGHTYPGATVPFGAVQLSPDTRKNDWGRLRPAIITAIRLSQVFRIRISAEPDVSISEISSFIRQVGHWIRNKEGTGFRRFPFPIGRNGHLQAIIK